MVAMEDIERLVRRIAEEFHPQKIILFGSYARGKPTPDSDVDLLVILPFEGHSAYKAAEIRLEVGGAFPMDLVVRTPATVRRRLAMGDQFLHEVLEEGKTLYEADHPRVD